MSRETMEFWEEWSAQVLLEGSVLPIIATVQGSKEGGVKTGSFRWGEERLWWEGTEKASVDQLLRTLLARGIET